MKKQLFILGMASVFALTGCHGIKKVEYAEFKEAVDELTEVKIQSVKISGKYDGTKISFTYKGLENLSLSDASEVAGYSEAQAAAASLADSMRTPKLFVALGEDSDCTYYTGMGFKVKSEDGSMEWAKNGLLASYKAKSDNHDCSFTFSWKKA